MLKVYGSDICPDCVAVRKRLEGDQTPFQYVVITKNTANLRQFLKLRDQNPLFNSVRENGSIGIPLMVFDDGRMSLDPSDVLFEKYNIRRAVMADLPQIKSVIGEAKNLMEQRKLHQWLEGYPTDEILTEDITSNSCFVSYEGNRITGLIVITLDGDSEYEQCQGNWRTNLPYGSLHRLAITNDKRGSGLALELMTFAEEYCLLNRRRYIRVDTGEGNLAMIQLLEKRGYESCGKGIFSLRPDGKWLLYDKLLKD